MYIKLKGDSESVYKAYHRFYEGAKYHVDVEFNSYTKELTIVMWSKDNDDRLPGK